MQHQKVNNTPGDNAPGTTAAGADAADACTQIDWPDDPSEIADPKVRAGYIEYHRRMLASLVGLPHVCAVKKCRRRNRCFGTGQPCLDHHRGLVAARFEGAWKRAGWGRKRDA